MVHQPTTLESAPGNSLALQALPPKTRLKLAPRSLALVLPRLPINRLARTGWPTEAELLAVTRQHKNAHRLISLNDAAIAAGLRPLMPLADARGIAPSLITEPDHEDRNRKLLQGLQRWSERFTPTCEAMVSSTAEGLPLYALILNITGCTHLFGGEEAMASDLLLALSHLQIEASIGIADTKGASLAAAQFGSKQTTIIDPGTTKTALANYSIDALMLAPKTLHDLKRLGLHRVGDLYSLKSAAIARRFGFGLLRSFEKLMGADSDPVLGTRTAPILATRLSFPDPIGVRDDIEEGLKRLLTQLCHRLEQQGLGTRAISLQIFRSDRTEDEITIGLAKPGRDKTIMFRQFALKLDRLDAGFGIDVMRLCAVHAEPFTPTQASFAGSEKANAKEELLATIGNRLGFDRVLTWEPVSSHLPNRSFRFTEASKMLALSDPEPTNDAITPPRPLTLIDHEPLEIGEPGRPPKTFAWRSSLYTTGKAIGPERIGAEWWKGHHSDVVRDYWQVATKEGPRFWLSCRPDQHPVKWSLAGIFL